MGKREGEWSFDSIGITNDLMFGTVFQDSELCRRLIEILLQTPISSIEYVESQRPIDVGPASRAGVVDLLVRDAEGNVFDLEMQNYTERDLPKRARRYLSLIDTMALAPGDEFGEAHGAVVIFICTHDPFGRGWKRYDFPRICEQDGEPLGDDTRLVFVNAQGDRGDVDDEYDAFIRYLVDHNDIESTYVRDLDERVRSWRENPLWRRYMVLWSEKYRNDFARATKEGREEGRMEGRKQGSDEERARIAQLAKQMSAQGRDGELLQAMQDPTALQKLLDEYGL